MSIANIDANSIRRYCTCSPTKLSTFGWLFCSKWGKPVISGLQSLTVLWIKIMSNWEMILNISLIIDCNLLNYSHEYKCWPFYWQIISKPRARKLPGSNYPEQVNVALGQVKMEGLWSGGQVKLALVFLLVDKEIEHCTPIGQVTFQWGQHDWKLKCSDPLGNWNYLIFFSCTAAASVILIYSCIYFYPESEVVHLLSWWSVCLER